jgi:glycosyltransferase involved in cell wall biosynthesis
MVTDFYAPYVGGVEQHTRVLAHALVDRGHDVAVATLAAGGLPLGRDDDGPVRVHRLHTTAQRAGGLFHDDARPWAPPIPDPRAVAALRRIVAAEHPDVVHGHDWLARSVMPLTLGHRAPPLVTTLHYYTRSCAKKTLVRHNAPCSGPSPSACAACAGAHYGVLKGELTLAGNWVGTAIEDRAARRTIAVSDAVARGNLTGSRALPYTVIPNPVVLDPAPPAELPPEAAEPFLLFAGGSRPEKGAAVVRAAYAQVAAPPRLLVVGPRAESGDPPAQAGVVDLGEVAHDVVRALWGKATLCLFPSTWPEPFGIAVVEAMAAGCPVVASRIGGIPEIVEDGRTGVLIPPGDVAALAEAIAGLLADPARRTALGAAARSAAARFAPDVVAAQVEAVYLDAIRDVRSSATSARP